VPRSAFICEGFAVASGLFSLFVFLFNYCLELITVGYAATNDATTNECYNEQFLSIKSGCYNEHRATAERGRILSADIAHACA
jgi:hypothetical protein